jgi:hypothetical protein
MNLLVLILIVSVACFVFLQFCFLSNSQYVPSTASSSSSSSSSSSTGIIHFEEGIGRWPVRSYILSLNVRRFEASARELERVGLGAEIIQLVPMPHTSKVTTQWLSVPVHKVRPDSKGSVQAQQLYLTNTMSWMMLYERVIAVDDSVRRKQEIDFKNVLCFLKKKKKKIAS